MVHDQTESSLDAARTSLDAVNDGFHDAYDDARSTAEGDAAVLVVSAGALVLFYDGVRKTVRFAPPAVDTLKAIAHVPPAIFAALHPRADGPIEDVTRARLEALLVHVTNAMRTVAEGADGGEIPATAMAVLEPSRAFLETTLARGTSIKAELRAFARGVGPSLLVATDVATGILLDALHAAVEEALAPLSDGARRELRVVVTGNHQARLRSLPMQYFAKRFGEPEGAEDRVAYAEGVDDVEEARALVGTRRLDHELATAFFGDARRLQRDVLGDAAASRLAAATFPPLA